MFRLLPATVLALLTLLACGGGEVAGEPAAEPPPLEGPVNDKGAASLEDDQLKMELGDFYFAPTFVQAIAGASVTLQLHNEGATAHTFTNDELGVDVTVDPGAEAEADVELPASGPVEFICRFHEAQGMRGAFSFAE